MSTAVTPALPPVYNLTLRNQRVNRCWQCLRLLNETELLVTMQISVGGVVAANVATHPPCFDDAKAVVGRMILKVTPSPVSMLA